MAITMRTCIQRFNEFAPRAIPIRSLAVLLLLLTHFGKTAFSQTKEESRVEAKVLELRRAMIEGDRKALEALTSDRLSYGHSSGLVEDKPSFIKKLVTGESDFVNMELSDQTVTVSGQTAIVRHRLDAEIKDGGKPGRVKLQVMLVWQKQAGDWRLLARQAIRLT
jgi:ketosteroid isomerase-like protein